MSDRPTLWLSNWSSHATEGHHGPGRKLTIMARPRRWEHGEGRVVALTPEAEWVCGLKAGKIALSAYRGRYVAGLETIASFGNLRPGELGVTRDGRPLGPVHDGDTLCCACSREAAAAGRCHRAWAAPLLVAAGWRVVLDGEVVGE